MTNDTAHGRSPDGSGSCPSDGAQWVSTVPASIPNARAAHAAGFVVDLIHEVGIYRLGGNDGCPCTNFQVMGVNVDVSCHKSEQCVRIYTHNDAFSDDNYRTDTDALGPIAQEVLRQVDAYYNGGGEYAAEFSVRHCSWDDDHPRIQSERTEA